MPGKTRKQLLEENEALRARLRDLENNVQRQQELEREKYYLSEAQEIGSIGTWELDVEANVLLWTPENYKIFGVPLGEPLNYERFLECVHPDDRDYINEQWQAGVRGEPYDVEHRVIANGDVKWVREKAKLFFNSEGRVVRAIGVTQDITYLKKTEFDLKHAKERAEGSDRLKSAFLANMSHDIRTPLNAIIGYTDLMLQDQVSARHHKFLTYIQQSGKVLLGLIDDILDLSKIEANQLVIKENPFRLREFMDNLHVMSKPLLDRQNKDVNLVYHIQPDISECLMGDEDRLNQIMLNLIGNSCKFTEKGKIEFGVKKVDEQSLEFYVIDTGRGIPREKLKQIFNPFHQIDPLDRKQYRGVGLGLTITRKLLQLMGGSIEVTSNDQKESGGTTMTITLPYKPTTIEDVEECKNTPLRKAKDLKKILIAEDDIINQILIQEILHQFGYETLLVDNGKKAVEFYNEDPSIDLILMDAQMPEMSGIEAIREIRKTNQTKRVPIIMLTASAMRGDREVGISAGADDYLTKPIDSDGLMETIQKYFPDS